MLIAPLADDHILPFDVNEEPHPVLVVFILQCEVYIVWPWRNDFEALEERARLPELVVDTELKTGRAVQKQQEAPLVDLRVHKILIIFHYSF